MTASPPRAGRCFIRPGSRDPIRPAAPTAPVPDATVPVATLLGIGIHLRVTPTGGERRTLAAVYAPLLLAAFDLTLLLTIGLGVPLLFQWKARCVGYLLSLATLTPRPQRTR